MRADRSKLLSALRIQCILGGALVLLQGSCSESSQVPEYRRVDTPVVAEESVSSQYTALHPQRRSVRELNPKEGEAPHIELLDGNTRFVEEATVHPRREAERREAVADAQHPPAAILSCSDSRVPPELIFDQGLGDLFVVRTAGAVADSAAIASLEYAIEHAGVKVVIVLGHTDCGAVEATLSTPVGQTAGSKHLDELIAAIRPHIEGFDLECAGDDCELASRAQADGVAADLIKGSKIIRDAVRKGEVQLLVGMYCLDTGTVDFWSPSDEETQSFTAE